MSIQYFQYTIYELLFLFVFLFVPGVKRPPVFDPLCISVILYVVYISHSVTVTIENTRAY